VPGPSFFLIVDGSQCVFILLRRRQDVEARIFAITNSSAKNNVFRLNIKFHRRCPKNEVMPLSASLPTEIKLYPRSSTYKQPVISKMTVGLPSSFGNSNTTSLDMLALISEVSASRTGRGSHTRNVPGTKACLEKNMEHVAPGSK
jgi:hypothetical protein